MINSILKQMLLSSKIMVLLLLLIIISSCSEDSDTPVPVDEVEEATVYQNSISIPLGGNAYQTDGSGSISIAENGVTFWDSSDAEFSSFVYSDSDMTIRLDCKS